MPNALLKMIEEREFRGCDVVFGARKMEHR
jgi:hypothetical protein